MRLINSFRFGELWTPDNSANVTPWAWFDFGDVDYKTGAAQEYLTIVNTDKISYCVDKSGNTRDIQQTTDSLRPTITTSFFGGRRSASCVDMYLSKANSGWINFTTARTVVCVYHSNSNIQTLYRSYIFGGGTGAASGQREFSLLAGGSNVGNPKLRFEAQAGAVVSPVPAPINVPQLVTAYNTGVNFSPFFGSIDGNDLIQSNPIGLLQTYYGSSFYLGRGLDDHKYRGKIAELFIGAGYPTTIEEKYKFDGWASHKWGVPLLVGHPYEFEAPKAGLILENGIWRPDFEEVEMMKYKKIEELFKQYKSGQFQEQQAA